MAALICTIEMGAGSHLTFHRLTYFYFLHYYGDDQLGEAGKKKNEDISAHEITHQISRLLFIDPNKNVG